MGTNMNIGQVARASGVPTKVIRRYETIGLLPAARRDKRGYRVYDAEDVHVLRFIRNARTAGLSVPSIAAMLELWRNRQRDDAEVRRLALFYVTALQEKAAVIAAVGRVLRLFLDARCDSHKT